MPYMQCNGHTISRYDNSDEAMKCRADEKQAYQDAYVLCSADNECRIEREYKHEVFEMFLCGAGVFFILAMVILIKALSDRD